MAITLKDRLELRRILAMFLENCAKYPNDAQRMEETFIAVELWMDVTIEKKVNTAVSILLGGQSKLKSS